MLGLLTLNWSLLAQWHPVPDAFTDVGSTSDLSRAWFEKWNRFVAWHPDCLVRVDGPNDLCRAKQEGKIGMPDANHLRSVDDVDAFCRMGTDRVRCGSGRADGDRWVALRTSVWAKVVSEVR
jgi:hypothetical protein